MKLSKSIQMLIDQAVSEDIGSGDITSLALIPEQQQASAQFIAKEPLVVCGQHIAKGVFAAVDSSLRYEPSSEDGQSVQSGEVLGIVSGTYRSILAAERAALNFMQRLSGVATSAFQVVSALEGLDVKVLDTRKTTPGWRELEKYAVNVGGGTNHRFGLYDAVLIKNNHIDAFDGNVAEAVQACRAAVSGGVKVEVEVRDMNELRQALAGQPDAILLDNMSPDELRKAVAIVREEFGLLSDKVELEASGGINSETARAYAETGVDALSMGSLTHSVRARDIALRYIKS